MTKKEEVEWITYIFERLNNKGVRWGCLSPEGIMFQVFDFTYTQVPKNIIDMLKEDNIIELNRNQKSYFYLTSKIKA